MNRILLSLVAAVAASPTLAQHIVPGIGGPQRGPYELSASTLEEVAPGVFATTLSVTNITGDSDFDVNSIDITIGTNGTLHNEQAFGGFAKGATLDDLESLPGFTSPALDSHFLPTVSLALEAPSEGDITEPTNVGSTLQGATSGFGAELTGTFGFQSSTTVDLAYLVVAGPLGEICVDYDVTFADGSPISPGERFVGTIGVLGCIPEPGTALLAGLAVVGLVARRR